jgi:hypothetical protein
MTPTCSLLRFPDSSQLFGSATQGDWLDVDRYVCPIEEDKFRGRRRWTEMFVQLKHNKREEMIVWTIGDCLMHQSSWLNFRPAALPVSDHFPRRFDSGTVSSRKNIGRSSLPAGRDWHTKNSGVERMGVCAGCRSQTYKLRGRPEQIVDWNQWTGDHFFRVWPWSKPVFIVAEVAEFLKKPKIRSFDLFRPEELGGLGRAGTVVAPPLSDVLPADLAALYEPTLHLE